MSINVTVNGNPVCVRRRVILSDLEQIKKNECQRRRRLRLEQVRQQSKEMSSTLLDRAKNIAKKTLNDIGNDKDSELRRMHDKKIMEIQQKYQEDMEDIGLAHTSAAAQPDVEIILESGRRKNQLAAAERGKEASQRLKESAMQEDPVAKQQERLRQVREVENVRSSMIANLSKRSPRKPKGPPPLHPSVPQPSPASTIPPTPSAPPEIPHQSPSLPRTSSKKRKHKKTLSKKSPSQVISKPPTRAISQASRPSRRVVVEIHQEGSPPDPRLRPPEPPKTSKPPRPKKIPELDEINRIEEINSDKPDKIDKNQQYNPSDYQHNPSSSSSPSVSDDSSYFSDGGASNTQEQMPPRKAPPKAKPPGKPASPSKVHLYDYNTRQRESYSRPPGVVERVELVDEPSAVELARKTSTLQSKEPSIQSQRARAQQRGANAALRERVKKDYHNLIQKLDHLSREEQKLKASQSSCHRSILDGKRRQLKKDMKQAEMNRAFEASRSDPIERIITINQSDGESMSDSPYDSVYERSDSSPVEEASSRNEQILEMLKKVERQKRLLLQEFGATLPDSVFNASMTRLFDTQRAREPAQEQKPVEEKPESPEIKIIKVTEATRKPQRIETAVQTSQTSPDAPDVNDKSIQVELTEPASTRVDRTSDPLEYVEPIVRIIHPEVGASSSDSSAPGIVIDFSRQQVKVTPTKRRTSRRKTPTSLPASGRTSPVKRVPEIETAPGSASASAPTSRVSSPQEVIEEEKPRKYKLPERKRVPPADTSTDVSFGQPARLREQGKSYVRVKQTILKRYYNNTSDTSTSYASLPAVQPGSSYPEAVANNMTPILQMLDSSANESVMRRFRDRDISPVSTPETPSPRVLRVPSNVPDAGRLGRLLKFDEGAAQEGPEGRRRRKSRERERPRKSPRETEVSYGDGGEEEEICRCKNPLCRLVHQDVGGVKADFGASKPETLKKYDELQNICAERIASLNALIKQVRDEQQEDYSLTAPSDDTSLMQMPAPRHRDSLHSVQKLVESIEAIHNQLAKTLQESQKIITGSLNASRRLDSPKLPEVPPPAPQKPQEAPKSPSLPLPPSPPHSELKKKPKVISEETVKINLQRFKSSLPKKEVPSHQQSSPKHDDIVEKLSLEILEQTKSSEQASASRRQPDSPVKREQPKVSSPTRKTPGPGETFIPLLAGIPKAPKPLPSIPQGNGHRRPPPVSHPVPYGIEALSPPHELSTIAEFDTPDTGNRSYMSARSPNGKSRRQLPLCAPQVQERIVEEAGVHEGKTKQSSVEEEGRLPEEKKDSNGSAKSSDSAGGNRQVEMNRSNKLITSSSSNSFSGVSGISEIISTPTSDATAWASSPPERMEDHLRKVGLGWAVPFLRKTREASALSSSSSSDRTLLATLRRTKSPVKKNGSSTPLTGLPDFSDVSSISIKEASKSTERAVLMKARTSTPNIQNSNYSGDKSTSNNSTSGISRDNSDSINLSPKKR
ncbi:serine/arginine repetitive matrix protein 2 [Diachasma alloeum]|uniref:serine/arginine repetitive matrix protein 2 n=1 Tax=Diachasma alloeum TaxID=454923 RepID=UPI0007382325|nr:serine/arginine repetitive matrix protein 2 [Diachasma alloeum]